MQLPLLFDQPPAPERSIRPSPQARSLEPKLTDRLDQRMPTREVLRIVGVNRSTVFRWIRKGLFPQKHVAGGWLRSDVEKWLSAKGGQLGPAVRERQ
jgi:predicted DNA-binding transcriptional regulator AlpA